jgi:putative CocE/NonD family hydrolase
MTVRSRTRVEVEPRAPTTPRPARRWRQVVARLLGLPPARYEVGVERDIPITMPDGAVLRTDRYWPQAPGPYPTVLIRTPYGRGLEAPGFNGLGMIVAAQAFASRGFAVVVQTVRGRFDSDGVFDPRVNEPSDGRATMQWITAQPWFGGSLGLWGQSYLGFVQWAVAADAPPALTAIVPSFTGATAAPRYYPDGAFALRSTLEWLHVLEDAAMPAHPRWRSFLRSLRRMDPKALARALAPAIHHLPLVETDARVVGKPVPFYQEMLTNRPADDPYWQVRDFSPGLSRVTAAISLMGGWYDLFLQDLLADYQALRAAGKSPDVTIGPWTHTELDGLLASLREGIRWFDIHLNVNSALERKQPVRLFLMGANEWRDYASWPPLSRERSYYLHTDSELHLGAPAADEPPDAYRYDPADPTPALGGPVLMPPNGPMDNRPLEARSDVLTYTSGPLPADLDVIGPVRLALYVRSSVVCTDFFGRLCDVSPDGRSINICDGLTRVSPGVGQRQPDGSLRIEVDMWATAQRFKRGHRLRLLVASAQHPRWARNLCTGEPAATSTRMVAAEQTIYHDAAHPSAVIVPVVRGSSEDIATLLRSANIS